MPAVVSPLLAPVLLELPELLLEVVSVPLLLSPALLEDEPPEEEVVSSGMVVVSPSPVVI